MYPKAGDTTGETFTATVVDTSGVLSATGAGVSGSGSTSLTIAGSLNDVNSDLSTLMVNEAGTASDAISVTVADSFGNSTGPQTTSVTVNPQLNLVINAPATSVVGLAKATPVSGLSLAETGARSGETFTVTVSDTNGALAATGANSNFNGTRLTIQGSLAQVNAALASLTDTDSNPAADTLSITATDSFGNAATPASTAITIANNPVIVAPSTLAVGVNQPVAVAGVSISETGATASETFTVTASDNNGQLAATGTGVSGSGTTSLSITGTLVDVNAALATLTDTDGTQVGDTIALSATDGFGNTAGAGSIAVTVNGVPSFYSYPASLSLQQSKPETFSAYITEPGDTTGENFTAVVSDQFGLLSAPGAGVTGSGTTTLTITGSLSDVQTSLASLSDTDGTPGTDTITLSAQDGFGNVALDVTIPVTIASNPVITAPASVSLGQGQPGAVGAVSISEPGAAPDETFTVTASDTNGLLNASGTGVTGTGTTSLTIAGSLAQVNAALATLTDTDATTASDTIVLAATDSVGGAAPGASIGVSVAGVPSIAAPATLILGQGQAGAVPGVVVSEAGAASGETFTVTVKDQNGLLSAAGTGVSGSGTTAVTFTGSLTQVNAGLATLGRHG